MTTKSLSAAQYILDKSREYGCVALTPMHLIKLAYIAHGWMLGVYGRPLLDEPVQAWQYGPVVPSVYHALKEFRSSAVPAVPRADRDFAFTAQERQILDYVAQQYGKYPATTLSSATHQAGTPWSVTWQREGRNATISNDVIAGHYADLRQQPSFSGL
jgi:uncharacterized phage-associated protein